MTVRRTRLGVWLGALILAGTLSGGILLAAAGRAQPRPSPLLPPGSRLIVGVVANSLDDNVTRQQGLARQVGVHWLREEFRWPVIEPSRGSWSFRRYDSLVSDAARRGLRILPLLLQSPRWLTRHVLALPPSLSLWRSFVTHVIARYGPGGRFWVEHPHLDARLAPSVYEIWNEPYNAAFSFGGPAPARYARLVQATVSAGRRVAPSVRFLMAADTHYAASDGSSRNWLDDLFAALPSLGTYIDGLAVHPYTLGDPASTSGPRDGQFARIDDLEATLVAHGVSARPLWVTEVGWSTCTQRPACVSEKTQAQHLASLFRVAGTLYASRIDAIFVYSLHDLYLPDPADPYLFYGVLRRNASHKPAWAVLDEAAREAVFAQLPRTPLGP